MSSVTLLAHSRDTRETFNDHLFIATDASTIGGKSGVWYMRARAQFSLSLPEHTLIYDMN